MATLVLPATDVLAHQLPSNDICEKNIASPQADGASFYNPEDSPSQAKYLPSQIEVIPTPTTKKVAPATSIPPTVQNPLRTANIPIEATDPLAFIDTYLNVTPKWSPESELEKAILKAQQRKTEEILFQRQRDSDVSSALEVRIREREGQLGALQAEMKRKVKHIESKKDALEQFRLDFAEAVKQQIPSSSTVQKSSMTRMREEQEKKKLLADWKNNNSEDQLQEIRRTILTSQDEVNGLNLRIVNLKKELELLHTMAGKSISSNFTMREQREKRKEMGPRDPSTPAPVAPKVQLPPQGPILRSHQNRMAEAKENKERARAARMAGSVPASPSNYASSSSSSSSSSAKQHP